MSVGYSSKGFAPGDDDADGGDFGVAHVAFDARRLDISEASATFATVKPESEMFSLYMPRAASVTTSTSARAKASLSSRCARLPSRAARPRPAPRLD
jgi:hypothetical protein